MFFDSDSPLDHALQELYDLISDFRQTSYGAGSSALARIVALFETEPLSGFLRARLPSVDYAEWFEEIGGTTHRGNVGAGSLVWPAGMAQKVALQAALVRDLAESEKKLLGFAHHFCYTGSNSFVDMYNTFADRVLDTMHRDLTRLAEARDVPPLLAPALGDLPLSGDAKLDALLAEAVAKFQDPSPREQHVALEKLWDAFERVKTLEGADKKASTRSLLERVAPHPEFREALSTEMMELRRIGNAFHIRHSETSQIELSNDRERDYLFFRLFALMHFLLAGTGSLMTQLPPNGKKRHAGPHDQQKAAEAE